MAPEDVMHLVNELEREVEIVVLAALAIHSEEVADSESISPELAARRRRSRETGGDGELVHQLPGQMVSGALIHSLSQSP